MYIPSSNSMNDRIETIAFMQRFSFAAIITSIDNLPTATHLPFLVEETKLGIKLTSHFALANPHWKSIEASKSLIIFSEPHAYISPKHYEKEESVPTWNYMAVHAYGQAKLIKEENTVFEVLEQMIVHYELDYKTQWEGLSIDFKRNMAKGIVAFEIIVEELQGKKKLSQNKSDKEQQNIIEALKQSDNSAEKLIAAYMKAEKHNKI